MVKLTGVMTFRAFSVQFEVKDREVVYTYMGRQIVYRSLDDGLTSDCLVQIPLRSFAASTRMLLWHHLEGENPKERRKRAERFCHLFGEDWELAAAALSTDFQIQYDEKRES